MMLQRITPFTELRQMQENMDRMRRRFAAPASDSPNPAGADAWAAPLDVVADGDNFVIRASLPGVAPENIQVSIEDNILTIRGETAAQFDRGEGAYLVRERRAGAFRRSLRLPDTVAQDQAQPRYEHGVLTITLPKAEAKRAKQFPVQVAESPAAIDAA